MKKNIKEELTRMKKLSGLLESDFINKNSNTSLRLVEVEYSGKKMNAVAIGYASGAYFKEVYFLLEPTKYENSDFDKVESIDSSKLIH